MLIALIVAGGVLETLSIGLVIPALAVMTQPDVGARYPAIGVWLSRLGNPTQNQLIVAGMTLLVVMYLFKTIVLGGLAWRQARFAFGLQAALSERVFSAYLRQPYSFHLQRNSAELINTAVSKVAGIAGVLQQSFMFIAETLVMAGISVMLFAVEPLGASLAVSVLAIAGWGFSRATRGRILRWGKAYQAHEEKRIQHLQQGLGGVKDAKLLGREDEFLAQYRADNLGSARAGELQGTLIALPRLGLELLAMIGLATLALTMLSQGAAPETMLPRLGLFAAAAFRLMPSVVRIIGGVQGVRYLMPVIDTLHKELRAMEASVELRTDHALPFGETLSLAGVSYRYPQSSLLALNDVSLSISRGSSVGIVGSSGAGKSTLVDIMLGLLAPTAGSVLVDGVDIQGALRGWQNQIGYVPQTIFLTDDSLRCNVAFGVPVNQIDERAVEKAIQAAQLEEFVASQPRGLDTSVGERGVRLSGGQRQRIGIARALYHEPSVLVLDEATSALDTLTEQGVMDGVRAMQGEKTVIIVAHRLSSVQHCSHIYRLSHGKVIEQGPASSVLPGRDAMNHG